MSRRFLNAKDFISRSIPNAPTSLVGLYAVDAVGAIVLNVVLARVLSLQEYGSLAGILSAGMFAFVMSDLGTGLSVCRLMASSHERVSHERFRTLWTVRFILTLVATASLASFAVICFPRAAVIVMLLLISEIFRSLAQFLSLAARGAGGIRSVVGIGIVDRVGTLVASFIALGCGKGLSGVAASYLLARVLSFSVALWWVARNDVSLRLARFTMAFGREFRSLTPLASLLVSDKIVFYSMPLLLSLLATTVDAGLFQAAFKVALLPISVCSALVGAYFPDFVRDAARHDHPDRAVAVFGLVMLLAAPVVSVCLALPRVVLGTLFGSAFIGASESLRLLGVFVVLNIAYQHSVYLLPAYHKESVLLRSTTASALGCLAIAAIFVPRLGAIGASWAVAGYAAMALVPHAIVLRGVLRVTFPQKRAMVESLLVCIGSIAAASVLGIFIAHPASLLGASIAVSGLMSLLVLARHWALFGQPLFGGDRSFEPVVLEEAAS